MGNESCDLLVIGGGPGGYTAAIRGAQKGLKAILVERGLLGGTCLNRGCIPTKALLEDALTIASVRDCSFMKGEMKVSLDRIRRRKDLLSENSRGGIAGVLAGNGVKILPGEAHFTGPRTVAVKRGAGGEEILSASHIVLATGARAEYGSGLAVDGLNVLSTEDALRLESIPRTLAVVGAGARGVEFAAIYAGLGARVLLIERNRRILSRFHPEVADRYKKSLLDRKIKVLTGTSLAAIHKKDGNRVTLLLASEKGEQEMEVEKVLLTGSRRPDYDGLHLEAVGLDASGGSLKYGPGMQTSSEGVYVVGDAAGPPYLAQKAICQGIAAVDHILGLQTEERAAHTPHCVWGDPEAASVGLTEEEALKAGRRVKVGEFQFVGNGRAGTLGKERGTVLIVSDSRTREILGVHMIGPRVTEMIPLACLAMENGLDLSGIKKTAFPHPTLSETLFEAALATDSEAIHMKVESEELDPEE